MSYRFRVDEGKLVLQVLVQEPASNYDYGWRQDRRVWRDAAVEDIPVADPFRSPAGDGSITYTMPDGSWGRDGRG